MIAKVDDVAAYIIEKEGRISTMKLQKLCYFAQGWSLSWTGQPLFNEPIEAWKYGPVVPELYLQHRRQTAVDSWEGDARNLTPSQQLIIDAMVNHYSAMSGFEMGEITHNHDSWDQAYNQVPSWARGNTEITQESMKQTFDALARQGHA